MLRRAFSRGFPVAGFFVLAVFACGQTSEPPPHVVVATNLVLPKGVLDQVSRLTLTIREGAVACDPAIGVTSFPSGADAATELERRDLGTTNCGAGVRFCGDVTIAKSDALRYFEAEAKGNGDKTLAIGCVSTTINQDAAAVAIKMVRFLAPSNCGDNVLQPTEQCEPKGTAVCDDSCMTKEILLSVGSPQNGTATGAAGAKADPSFLWPSQTAANGRLLAFYTDHIASGGKDDIGLRVMADDLSPTGTADAPALAAGAIFLPNDKEAAFPPAPAPFAQSKPQAAFLKSKYYVVFEDDNTPPTQPGTDVHLRSMDSAFVADQGPTPLTVNGGADGTGEPAIQGSPAIAAGPAGRLFIAWEDAGEGKIAGRTFTPPTALGNQNDLSTGNGNRGVSLAPTLAGWVAVWQSGSSVKLRVVNKDGTPQGSEQTVNDAGTVTERPRVASVADGRFAVTWSAGGDIFVQRYDAKGGKIAGDQGTPINDIVSAGVQSSPSIAGTSAVGGSYVIVWLDAASGHVRGRMLGGSAGFLFNHENGQASEFQASRADGRERATPVVVSGGSGPFVAIGWEDRTATGSGQGIVARRFPLPE